MGGGQGGPGGGARGSRKGGPAAAFPAGRSEQTATRRREGAAAVVGRPLFICFSLGFVCLFYCLTSRRMIDEQRKKEIKSHISLPLSL